MKQNIKNNYLLIICSIVIAVFVAVIFGLTTNLSQTENLAVAESSAIILDGSVGIDASVVNSDNIITLNNKTFYKVETAGQLKYVLRTNTSGKSFLLMHDFTITDPNWVNGNTSTAINNNIYGYVLDEKGKIVSGEKRTLNFASSKPTNAQGDPIFHQTKIAGLFGSFSGTLSNLTYRFSGTIEISGEGYSDNTLTILAGGLAGIFSGTIDACNIITTGSITTYAQRSKVNTYIGGIAGQYISAHITNGSVVSIGGSFIANNKLINTEDDAKLDALNTKMYVGGIAGYVEETGAVNVNVPNITNSEILISASLSTNDVIDTTLMQEIIGSNAFTGWFAKIFDRKSANGDEYILPAAGLFAEAKKIEIRDSEINIAGTITSTGDYLSNKIGVITGGLIGITSSNATIKINRSTIKLSGKMVARNEAKQKATTKDYLGIVYQGGIIGKITDALDTTSLFSNNVIEKDGDFYTQIDTSKDPNYCAGGQYNGYLVGMNTNNAFASFNKGNNWILGDTTGLVYAQSSSNNTYGLIHTIKTLGGGFLTHSVDSQDSISFFANQEYAPFTGWYTSEANLRSNNKYTDASEVFPYEPWDVELGMNVSESRYTPSKTKSSPVNMIVAFITSEIKTAGNMVEFAEEMNNGLNFNWITVDLMNDISFTKGMPVIEQFNGSFNGNGHKITFESTSSIVGTEKVAMFAELSANASFTNTEIVFAGTIYAGNATKDKDGKYVLDDKTIAAVLVATNKGTINNVKLDFTQAGTISSFAKTNVVGGLIGENLAAKSTALSQADITIDGKFTVVGYDNSIGCVVGFNQSSGKYQMINVFAKGEIVSATLKADQGVVGKASLGGMVGKLGAVLLTENVVINVRDYSNYNNNVLMASCTCNEENYKALINDLNELKSEVIKANAILSRDGIKDILDDYFGYDGSDPLLGVAQRSQEDYQAVYSSFVSLYNAWANTNEVTLAQRNQFLQDIKTVETFDCAAQCGTCKKNTNIFAIVGSRDSYNVGFNNTWIMGSYTQYPDDISQDGVGTNKLYILSKTDKLDELKASGLNVLYVRDGSATCLMDIAENNPFNIKFTVSVDTTKVFTGWYTTFNHSVMIDRAYIQSHTDENGAIVQVLQPGAQSGLAVYSSVINSLITTADTLTKLATTTNAGQTYQGVKFVLGGNIEVTSAFTAIGSDQYNCFDGMFDGKGYTISIAAGLTTSSSHAYGLFGYLGANAVIKQLNVLYTGTNIQLNDEQGVFGGISAYNAGEIGQNSTSNKVTVIIEKTISGVRVAGGLVGINMGLVQNCEVKFVETAVRTRGSLQAKTFGDTDVQSAGIVGGAVGYNMYTTKTTLKNTLVTTECTLGQSVPNLYVTENAGAKQSYAGGMVGYNDSRVYSCVVRVAYESSGATITSVPSAQNAYQAILIGYNNVANYTEGLWALYAFDSTYSDYAFRTPALTSDGTNNTPYTYQYDLINGEDATTGNRLVKYGYGDIKVSIYANNESQPNGGSIVFEAVEMIPDGKLVAVPFYNYTVSMTENGVVSSADGGSGQNFAPSVKTTNKEALKGVDYYAVFVKTEISSSSDFYEFIETINNGFKAYANYIVKLQGQSDINLFTSDDYYKNIDLTQEFVGNFNGNGYSIRIHSASDIMGTRMDGYALFGIVGETSIISNVTYMVEAGTDFKTPSQFGGISALGSFVNVNKGLIENITFITSASVFGSSDINYVGGLVGFNCGTISSVEVTFNFDNKQGNDFAGRVVGTVAGGVVGYNSGLVGSDRLDSVRITLNTGNLQSSVMGSTVAGGIVGINDGTIKNVSARVYGRISAPNFTDDGNKFQSSNGTILYDLSSVNVGGVVGINRSEVVSAVSFIYQGATVYTFGDDGAVGGVVGKNESATIGDSNEADSVKVYIQSAISGTNNTSFGGIVGSNTGNSKIVNCLVNITSEITGFVNIGGAVGLSESGATVEKVNVAINTTGSLNGYAVGGLVGKNSGRLSLSYVNLDGKLGSTSTKYCGGLIGNNQSSMVSDMFVIVRNTIQSGSDGLAGLVAGTSYNVANETVNIWAVASNADTLTASGNGNVGFNTLKIVGKTTVNAEFTGTNTIKFTASVIKDSTITWYSDISVLESFGKSTNIFVAEENLKNVSYHVCYYNLLIKNSDDFNKIYQYVNDNDLFHGVMFKIDTRHEDGTPGEIVLTRTVNPIGTVEHPFTGIFDGDYSKIIIQKGGIAGSDYSGIFGYVADTAVIKNVIVEVHEDVIVGSGMCTYAGILAGHLGGKLQNVYINAMSAPYSLKADAFVGALAGSVSQNIELKDVWTIIYNGAVDAIGTRAGVVDGKDDIVNKVSVIGIGKLSVDTKYQDNSYAIYFNITDGLDYYNNWYYDIGTRTELGSMNKNIYGDIYQDSALGTITYNVFPNIRENAQLSKINFTLSFIDLVIRSTEDFYRFAENINRFGDNGAMFTLNLGFDEGNNYIDEIVLDMSRLAPIGTKEHPFTGIFDGMVDGDIFAGNSCHTIRLIGDLSSDYNDYTGLFGFVGEGAKIRNLIVRAHNRTEDENFESQIFGDKKSIYTGFLAGFLQGEIDNVAVVLSSETELYNINADSVGGLVGVMGTKAKFVNTWLVLGENSTYRAVGGYKQNNGEIVICDSVTTEQLSHTTQMPGIVYVCGVGNMNITFGNSGSGVLSTENAQFVFRLSSLPGGERVYGFLPENDDNEENRVETLTGKYSQPINGVNYLAVFLDSSIRSYEDLVKLATITNQGRLYKGIEFTQTQDIYFPQDALYTPIGGQVSFESTIGTEYKLIEFIGIYNGNGYKIVVPESVTIDEAYAGIFGILGSSARISNLRIEVAGQVGTSQAKYAGALAGLDNGATLRNIIVELKKSASVQASLGTGRVAVNGFVQTDVYGNVTNWSSVKTAENVWVLAYNNRFNSEANLSEQAFYDVDKTNSNFVQQGVYNGGINVITIIGAGEISINFVTRNEAITGVNISRNGAKSVKEWYWLNNGVKEQYNAISLTESNTTLDSSVNSMVLYASFLNEVISTASDLLDLAIDTNSGYDFYGLTFTLANDVTITRDPNKEYIGIGADIPFNATFDGQGHKIIVDKDVIIKGKYAGIFGNIGEYGQLKNIILEVNGQIGWINYTPEEVASGKDNTMYAGAVAYIQGTLDSVIIIGTNATIDCIASPDGNTYGAIAFGMDTRNLLKNTWVISSAQNQAKEIGFVTNVSDSSINLMKVVGMGSLNLGFEIVDGNYVIVMTNNFSEQSHYSIKGWYSNYMKDNQLSIALGVTELNTQGIRVGDNGFYYPKTSLINRRYEVVIINTVITQVEQLLSIASDVNKGGYTFENTEFALGANIKITTDEFTSIGTSATHFKGGFTGQYNGRYYTITLAMTSTNADMSKTPKSVPLFGYNEGIIEDLSVVIEEDIRLSSADVGVIASHNLGTIRGVIVSFAENKKVVVEGSRVGGLVAVNHQNARIENCIIIVNQQATIKGVVVGGIVAENNGYLVGSTGGDNSNFSVWAEQRSNVLCGLTEYANVNILGTMLATSTDNTVAYIGGAAGVSQDLAYLTRITVRIYDSGFISANASAYAVGGVVGRSSATLINSVCISKGNLQGVGTGDLGYFVGSIQGTATNSWLVVDVPTTAKAIGNGYEAVNILQVSGNGIIDAYIDSSNNIIFINITEKKSVGTTTSAQIDGWYESNGITVTDSIGNVDENTFKPATNITGRTINVVFINLMISSVEDLIVMAKTVNNGLFAKSLVFKLTQDLVITSAQPLTDCIGIYTESGAYGFKHIFDGQNHTITFKVSEGDQEHSPAMLNQAYMGVFGYTSNSAVIKNLNVVYESGTFGSYQTVDFGGISGYNSGDIIDCTVTINIGVSIIAQKVGGVAGENTRLGTISDCTVVNEGLLRAETAFMPDNTSPNAYVGGVVGSNAGTIKNIVVTHRPSVGITQPSGSTSLSAINHEGSTGATYAGGVTGSNSYHITNVKVYIINTGIKAESEISAYAGGFSGSNMGTIENSYVLLEDKAAINSSNGIESIAGGIVGANGQTINNVLVDVSQETFVTDSAIGRDKATTSDVNNVWVYYANSTSVNRISMVNAVNCMAYEMVANAPNVVYNSVDEILEQGLIVFSAVLDDSQGITLFAQAETEYSTVLLFDTGYLTYSRVVVDELDTRNLVFTSNAQTRAIHLKATIRRVFNDQTELKALSTALSKGIQSIDGEYSIASDIVITGNFTAIGNAEHPFNALFQGNYNSITFDNTTVDGVSTPVVYGDGSQSALKSLFGQNSGTIEKLSITYNYSLEESNSAGIAVLNKGTISNCVIYTALDVNLLNVVASGVSSNDNVWVISRVPTDDYPLQGSSNQNNMYYSIVINGKGDLQINKEAPILTFNPICLTDNTMFAGFAGENKYGYVEIISDEPFVTKDERYSNNVSFSAEFISSVIENKADLMAFISVLELNYGGFSVDKVYTMAGNITVSVDEILPINKFLGIFDGGNYVLTITGCVLNDGDTGCVFKECENSNLATFKNLTFDVRDWVDADIKMFLFDDDYKGNLENVSILMATDDLRLADRGYKPDLQATNVYVVTNSQPDSASFFANTTEGIGLIIVDGYKDLTFQTVNGKYYATAYEENSEVFIGWYSGSFDAASKRIVDSFVGSTSMQVELNSNADIYRTTFMSTLLIDDQGSELQLLSEAIARGFDMNGKEFKLDCDIILEDSFILGGNSKFLGTINGAGYHIYAESKLFNTFQGTLKNIVIDISSDNMLATRIDGATLENVVLRSAANDVKFSQNTDADITNCWILAGSSSEVGVNILSGNFRQVTINAEFDIRDNDGLVNILLSVDPASEETFIIWKKADGSIFLNQEYYYIEASNELVNYNIIATNKIYNIDDIKAMAIAVRVGKYIYPVYLENDITLDSTYVPVDNSNVPFYGQGHTVTVVNTTSKFSLFTNLAGVVYDLKMVAGGNQDVEIATATNETSALVNCVIELYDNATAAIEGGIDNINNSWIVKKVDQDNYQEFKSENQGKVANIFAYRFGKVITTINPQDKNITFEFEDDENLVLLGYVDNVDSYTTKSYVSTYTEDVGAEICNVSVIAYILNKTINNQSDWNSVVNAVNMTGNSLQGVELELGADISLTYVQGGIKYIEKLTGFQGILNGNFNSIVINVVDENGIAQSISAGYNGFIETAGDGVVKNLAVEVFTQVSNVLKCNVQNCWVISYIDTVDTNAGVIKVVNKEGKHSVITVNESNGYFAFNTNDQDEYKLYHWFKLDTFVAGDIENNNNYILEYQNGYFALNGIEVNKVVAEYQECYTIYVDVVDPITNSPLVGVRPNVQVNQTKTPSYTYFPVETDAINIYAEMTEGFVFWGFAYDDPYNAIEYDMVGNIKYAKVPVISKLKGSIRVTAYYSLMSTNFVSITYGDMTATEIKDYLKLNSAQVDMLQQLNNTLHAINPSAQSFSITTSFRAESDTLPLVYDEDLGMALPKHAGNYEITFDISRGASFTIGRASFSFIIKPKELTFKELMLEEKVYDATPYTKIYQKVLSGFIDQDNQDKKIATLDFSHIKVAFVDPVTGEIVSNAGTGYYVMITEDSYLETNSFEYFFNIDYTLPKGKILRRVVDGVELEPFTFGIEKANLSISIPTITIDYLDQFEIGADGYFDINELFSKYYKVEGLKDGDADVLANAKLLLVEGDEIVNVNGTLQYKYYLKTPGSYSITPISGILENYNVTTETSTSRLRINPSAITPKLNEISVEYGSSISKLAYSFAKAGDSEQFQITEQQYGDFAAWFGLKLTYSQFVDKYLSLNLAVDSIYNVDGDNVLPLPTGEKYGIQYRFLQTANFVYAETADSEFVYNSNNQKEYILKEDGVLSVTARNIVVEYTGSASKVFASPDADFVTSARTTGSQRLVNGDTFYITRAGVGDKSGELVGEYELMFAIHNKQGEDITSYYNISYKNEVGYTYSITKRIVKVSHLGGSYYYGDIQSTQNMKYSTNLSTTVVQAILDVFGTSASKTLEDIGIKLRVGYFGTEIQNVGTYACQYEFVSPDNMKSCLEFVMDAKNDKYTIIPAKLNIVTKDATRVYDKTDEIKFATSEDMFTVSGFVGNDSKALVVRYNGYTGDVKANAGTYLYRPTGCILALRNGYEDQSYLLENYAIDKISNGKYTITPLKVEIGFNAGYYLEDDSFVATDNWYFGDMSGTLNFYLNGSLYGYLQELYDAEIDLDIATDKQISEWLIEKLNISYMSLFTLDAEVGSVSVVSGTNQNTLYLRSENPNITIVTSGFFTVTKVYYIIKDFELTTDHGSGLISASAKIDVIDDMDDPIDHYVFNSEITNLKPGESFKFSNNVEFKYELVSEYVEGGNANYKFSLQHYNKLGNWATPEDDTIYMVTKDKNGNETMNTLTTEDVQVSNVTVSFTDWDKIVDVVKNKPGVVVGIVLGVVALVAIISAIGVAVYRKKRITKAAWRELLFKDMWKKQNEKAQEPDDEAEGDEQSDEQDGENQSTEQGGEQQESTDTNGDDSSNN